VTRASIIACRCARGISPSPPPSPFFLSARSQARSTRCARELDRRPTVVGSVLVACRYYLPIGKTKIAFFSCFSFSNFALINGAAFRLITRNVIRACSSGLRNAENRCPTLALSSLSIYAILVELINNEIPVHYVRLIVQRSYRERKKFMYHLTAMSMHYFSKTFICS